jgi:phosphoribosylanthranilate isomerase
MTWVKICGITNLEDALVAVEAGADAVGFVFYEKSPRNVHPQTASEITSRVPATVEKVGVFVGTSVSAKIVHQAKLTAVQLHSTASSIKNQPLKKLAESCEKVFFAISAEQLLKSRIGGYQWRLRAKDIIDAVLLDSGSPKQPGGTGKPLDWKKIGPVVSEIGKQFDIIVAGGLTPDNVTEAMRVLRPWGVDVSSGVEERPGKKDPHKVRAFVKAVRDADKANSRN